MQNFVACSKSGKVPQYRKADIFLFFIRINESPIFIGFFIDLNVRVVTLKLYLRNIRTCLQDVRKMFIGCPKVDVKRVSRGYLEGPNECCEGGILLNSTLIFCIKYMQILNYIR